MNSKIDGKLSEEEKWRNKPPDLYKSKGFSNIRNGIYIHYYETFSMHSNHQNKSNYDLAEHNCWCMHFTEIGL